MLCSKRRKRTKLLVNHCCFSHFRRECENAHEHDAWGTRPQGGATAHEVEYPHGLCREWAACLREPRSIRQFQFDMQCDTEASIHLQAQAVVGKHVRGKALKPLMLNMTML